MDRFRIHTNWTNTVQVIHEITLDDLHEPEKRQYLKWAFSDPERLKPGKTCQTLTEEAAEQFREPGSSGSARAAMIPKWSHISSTGWYSACLRRILGFPQFWSKKQRSVASYCI